MKEETLSGVPVSSSRPKAPTSDRGAADRMTSAGVKRRNCATSTASTSSKAIASTSSIERNEACWLSCSPPMLYE